MTGVSPTTTMHRPKLTCDMLDERIARHRLRHVRQANHELHDVLIQPTSLETRSDPANEPQGRPRDLLGALDDDRVAREEGGENRRDEVVERVVP